MLIKVIKSPNGQGYKVLVDGAELFDGLDYEALCDLTIGQIDELAATYLVTHKLVYVLHGKQYDTYEEAKEEWRHHCGIISCEYVKIN